MGVGAEEAAGRATSGSGAAAALRLPRPRSLPAPDLTDRLLRLGAGALNDNELLAVLLGGGGRGLRLPDLADRLIAAGGGLKALAQTDPHELCAGRGLGPKDGPRLLAALELGRRVQRCAEKRPRLRTPTELFRHLSPVLCARRREEFHVLCFNARNVLLLDACVAQGTTNECPVDPREVFAPALGTRATAIVLAHNHPSGDVQPSAPDIELTRRLARGGALLGIHLLDHLILGDGTYASFLELGLMRSHATEAGASRWNDRF